MIDARFSAEAFDALEPGSLAAERLCAALSSELANEIRDAIECRVLQVVEQLRALGHDLHNWNSEHSPCDEFSFGPTWLPPESGWLAIFYQRFSSVSWLRTEQFTGADNGQKFPGDEVQPDDEVPF
jgi:hypothetical protein